MYPQEDATCTDNHRYCTYWASIGECQVNPLALWGLCKKSCGRCILDQCSDLDPHCADLAFKGKCGEDTSYMEANCRTSCSVGECKTQDLGPVKCVGDCCDRTRAGNCEQWAGMGDCDRNSSYMSKFCKATCGTC